MTVSETLTKTWDAVIAEASQGEGYYHRRIPLSCVWPTHAGVHRPTNARILILETDLQLVRSLRTQDETRGYSIDVAPDEVGRTDRAAVRIQETSSGYREIFTIFCADILEHWIPHPNASDSLTSLNLRLARWKKFFQRGPQPGLTRDEYVGLYGELTFIEAALRAGVAPVDIIAAWQAPLGTNQDFIFGQLATEIKTITSNEIDKVRITNARQLDSTGLQTLILARYAFDFRQSSGRSLPQLIDSLRKSLTSVSPEIASVFDDRLMESGFVDGMQNEFDACGFTPRYFDAFIVGRGFPCLLESSLPPGVSEITYTLNLSAAQSFRISETDCWGRITSSYGRPIQTPRISQRD